MPGPLIKLPIPLSRVLPILEPVSSPTKLFNPSAKLLTVSKTFSIPGPRVISPRFAASSLIESPV